MKSDIMPDNTWVRSKISGSLRYVTQQTDKYRFLDDGKKSKQKSSLNCWYGNYKPIDLDDIIERFIIEIENLEGEYKELHKRIEDLIDELEKQESPF